MTANAFMSVSLNPPLIAVAVDNRAHMKDFLLVDRTFGVSVLSEDQERLSRHFAGRPMEGLQIDFARVNETPLIQGALAHLVARIVDIHPAGDHTLYIGQVEYIAWGESRPLVFYGGQYHHLMLNQVERPSLREDEMSLFSMGNFDILTTKDADQASSENG
jgi:flavin reductase (DIM6/NTAB) family NADH-FMN oxidoreductase RutF